MVSFRPKATVSQQLLTLPVPSPPPAGGKGRCREKWEGLPSRLFQEQAEGAGRCFVCQFSLGFLLSHQLLNSSNRAASFLLLRRVSWQQAVRCSYGLRSSSSACSPDPFWRWCCQPGNSPEWTRPSGASEVGECVLVHYSAQLNG